MPDCKCKTCGKTYSKASSLKRHQELHQDIRSEYPCPFEGCDKVIKRLDLFLRHKKTHTGEGWAYCPHCTKGFNRKGQLAKHKEKCHMRLEAAACTKDLARDRSTINVQAEVVVFKNDGLAGHDLHSRLCHGPLQVIQMPGSQKYQDDLRQRRRTRQQQLQTERGDALLIWEIESIFTQAGVDELRDLIATLPVKWRSVAKLNQLYRDLSCKREESRVPWESKRTSALLNLAAIYDRVDLLEFLIRSGVEVEDVDYYGRGILHWAAKKDHVEMVAWLLDHGADIERSEYHRHDGYTALHVAVYFGSLDTVRLLLQKGAVVRASYDKHGFGTGLILGDAVWHVEVLESLLVKSNALAGHLDYQYEDGRTVLHIAAEEGKVDVIELLLDHGASIDPTDAENKTPLVSTIAWGNLEAFALLLARGACVDGAPGHYGRTPLMAAAYCSGPLEFLRTLIKAGAQVNLCRPHWEGGRPVTALAEACGYSSNRDEEECKRKIKLLLAAGADVNLGELTPLENALELQGVEIVELLFEACAKVLRLPEECMSDLRAKASDPSFKPSGIPDYYNAYKIEPEKKLQLLEHYSRPENDPTIVVQD